jgi:hypothetical protein
LWLSFTHFSPGGHYFVCQSRFLFWISNMWQCESCFTVITEFVSWKANIKCLFWPGYHFMILMTAALHSSQNTADSRMVRIDLYNWHVFRLHLSSKQGFMNTIPQILK